MLQLQRWHVLLLKQTGSSISPLGTQKVHSLSSSSRRRCRIQGSCSPEFDCHQRLGLLTPSQLRHSSPLTGWSTFPTGAALIGLRHVVSFRFGLPGTFQSQSLEPHLDKSDPHRIENSSSRLPMLGISSLRLLEA